IGDQLAVVADAHLWLADNLADDHAIESPLLEDTEHFVLAALFGDQQHALLALGEHDLVAGHAGFTLRHVVELNVEANTAAGTHLAGGAGKTRRAHVLNTND